MFRFGLLLRAAILGTSGACVATALPQVPASASGHYAEVTLEPTERLIYLASVSLNIQPAARRDGVYRAAYVVKVFPFFFYNEHGEISIEVSNDQLHQLERGETVSFTGHAANSAGKDHRIEGRAVPDDGGTDHGRIKVQVWASKNIVITFNTVYRFTGKE